MTNKISKSFSDDKRAAMRERALELKADNGEMAVLAAIAKMPEPDRSMAKRIHDIVKATAPNLFPKTWYGMPAYANGEGNVACFFQAASKFKYRYSTLGFQKDAHLDDGNMWPSSFAIKKLTSAEETKITALIKKVHELTI